jgi:hypothetical protein
MAFMMASNRKVDGILPESGKQGAIHADRYRSAQGYRWRQAVQPYRSRWAFPLGQHNRGQALALEVPL